MVIVGSGIGILIIFSLGWAVSSSISKPLRRFIKLANAIAKGDMNKRLDIASDDEIGELAEAFKEMATGLEASKSSLEEQNWLQSNLNEVSSKAQDAMKLEDITEVVIRMLCPLLGAPAGAIYITEGASIEKEGEEEGLSLALYSSYGFKPAVGSQVRFKFGEGIVGQCALEKKQIFLNLKSPEQTITNAGAGIKEPSYLMLTPIVFEQKLLGVIQIFTYSEMSDIKKSLASQLAGQIGGIINSANFTLGIETLLEQSRRYRARLEESKQNLENKAIELEEASRYKSEFLASMSHEIRTPMNAIIGMADLLSETNLTEEQLGYVNTYRYAGENLLNIINDILDLSKIESGQLELEKTGFDLQELIERTSEIMAISANAKGIELLNLVTEDTPQLLIGDPTRLRQVIINLTGNALKFTEKGEVVIGVETIEVAKNDAELRFYVKDTGIGIPKDKSQFIFESFTQADSSTTRKYGGTGLGLSICKLIVELMGGKIWVESDEGKGSVFYFTARLEIDKKSAKTPQTVVDMKGLKVLIVDDNGTNRMILNKRLSGWGSETKEAVDGKSCLNELKDASKVGRPYDLVLLDYMMPGMDGLEVAGKIKGDAGISAPIIMITSSLGSAFGREQAKKIGIDGYMHKPVKLSELQKNINIVLGKTEAAEEKKVVAADNVFTDKPKKILLVEDNCDNQNLILAYLKKSAHGIKTAENGQIAVDMFKSESFDLVLMDMQMPVMDGCTATKNIRQWENEKGSEPTPIIALTAHALKEHEEQSKEAGCNAHITKPIKKATLLETLRRF